MFTLVKVHSIAFLRKLVFAKCLFMYVSSPANAFNSGCNASKAFERILSAWPTV